MTTIYQPITIGPGQSLASGSYVAAATMPYMVKILASADDRLDAIRDVELDGGDLAQVGLLLDVVVQRHFESLHISRCGTGLVLNGTQNCNFEAVHVENCTQMGIRINHGAGGNVFERCDANECGQPLVIVQDDALDGLPDGTPGIHVYAYGPSNNSFYACILERGTNPAQPSVVVGAGLGNSFYACGFSADPDRTPLFVGRLSQAPFSAAHTFDGCDLYAHRPVVVVEAWNIRMRSWNLNLNASPVAFSLSQARVLSDGLHHLASGSVVANATPAPPWGWWEPLLSQVA